MPATWVDIRTPPPMRLLGLLLGYADLVIEVGDAARAQQFYADLLGFAPDGETLGGPRLRVGPGQRLVLAERDAPATRPDSGTHYAYRFPATALAQTLARLERAGVPVLRHREDRPAERDANRYCVDPDGNRLQLVQGPERGVDHVAVETHDLEWAEVFYTQVLGSHVETRVGWHMDDYARAREWGAGEDDCAPGTRRWDRPYTADIGERQLPRPNPQCFVTFAPGVVLGLYLATEHRQEPPPDQFVGTPRIGLRVAPGRLAEVERRLREVRLRCMQPCEKTGGPFERVGDSLFVRDPGGNFLELSE